MSFLNRLKQAKDVVAHKIEELAAPAPKELADERMAICHACPHLGKLNRCKECGCFMDAKTKMLHQKCPLGKW